VKVDVFTGRRRGKLEKLLQGIAGDKRQRRSKGLPDPGVAQGGEIHLPLAGKFGGIDDRGLGPPGGGTPELKRATCSLPEPWPFWQDVIKIASPPRVGVRHRNDHWRGPALPDCLVGNVQDFTELHPARVVIPTPMQEIKHGIAALGGVIIGWKVNGKTPIALQDITEH